MSYPIWKIIMMFSRLEQYVIMQVHACREEKVMVTSGEENKPGHCYISFLHDDFTMHKSGLLVMV